MTWPQVVAVAVFVIVAVVLAAGLQRTGTVLAKTRRAEGFIGAVSDLGARISVSLGELGSVVDAVRRGAAEPDSIHANLAAGAEAVERYAEEARSLPAPTEATTERDLMVGEIERAGRAIELIDHGCRLATSGRRADRGPETEISIKRGYLNLIHAREAIEEHAAAAIASAEAASPVRRLFRRPPSDEGS